MIQLIRLTFLSLMLMFSPSAGAGERVAFIPGAEIGGEKVLGHLKLKSVITEFLDPQDTGLGLPLTLKGPFKGYTVCLIIIIHGYYHHS